MRLKRVTVSGLFGMFDHDIRFPDREDVVIVHGPNGVGKTVMLRMIGALVAGQGDVFQHIPFSEFTMEFDDGSRRSATRYEETSDTPSKAPIRYVHQLADGTTYELTPPPPVPKQVLDFIDPYVPRMSRSKDGWRDAHGRFYSLADVLARYPAARDRLPPEYRSPMQWLEIEGFRLFFVETNRLIGSLEGAGDRPHRFYYTSEYAFETPVEEVPPLRVVQYSAELTRRIQSILASYAKHSQESDRTFPERLVHFLRTQQPALSEREILTQMAELEESRQRLIDLGILDTEKGLRDLTEEDVNRAREALTIYVADVRQKLKAFDEMAVRVGMLRDIVNERFKYKTLAIDREHGLHFRTTRNTTVAPSNLSSGEQHQLVLLYELLFMVPKNGLVLIDEPEISLHVGWQARFVKDLLAILRVTGAHAMIATHAPAIIGNRWDLAVGLKGPGGEDLQDSDATAV